MPRAPVPPGVEPPRLAGYAILGRVPVFVASWGRPRSDEAGLRATLEALARFRDSLRAARVMAALAFAWLFLAGPALTLTLGPDAAVLYTAAGLYPTVLAAIVALWWRR